MDNYKIMPTQSFKDLCELCSEILNGETSVNNAYTIYKSPGSFWYNRNFIETIDKEKIIESIQNIKKNISTGLPFLISATKYDDDHSVDSFFSEEGYQLLVNQIGMNFDLTKDFDQSVDSNISLIDSDKIEEWDKVISFAFGKPGDFETFLALSKTGKCNIYAYIEEDRILGTSLLYTKNGNAGIHEVSVLPEYRGKGIAKKLINRILQDAKKDGSKVASLQASALGEPLYKSIGFEIVSLVSTYILPPPK